jgi:membrane peptidoglycan carboxypeptidase
MQSASYIIRARRRRRLQPGHSPWWLKVSLVLLTLAVLAVGIVGMLTAYLLAENVVTAGAGEPIELSFMQSGREAHQPVRFYDRDQLEVLFEALNPEAQSRRWYQIDPEGPIVLPEYVIQASVASQANDYWSASSRPLNDTLDIFALLWNRTGNQAEDEGIVDLLAEAQVLPLTTEVNIDPVMHAVRRQLARAELNARYSRVELLEFFINTADYGNLAYGIDAAALVYFGKHASSLTLAESAMLAPIPFEPEINPFDAPEQARVRQKGLLDQMRSKGLISRAEALRALNESLLFTSRENQAGSSLQNFLFDAFVHQFGREALGRTGLEVRTTIDADLQLESQCVLVTHLDRLNAGEPDGKSSDCLASELLPPLRPGDAGQDHNVKSGSLVVLDAARGEILSLVGEANVERPMATLSQPFIYLAAFAEGYSPGSMVMDIPEGSDESNAFPGLELESYHGPVRIRTAMSNGFTAAAGQMVDLVGKESVLSIFETMGIEVGFGAGDEPGMWRANLLDLVHASSVFADNGSLTGLPREDAADTLEPVVFLDIQDDSDHLVYSAEPQRKAVLSEQLAFLVNDVLRDEVSRRERLGPSNPLEVNRPAAATVAITGDERDAWALGYTPERVVGVWIGSPAGKAPSGLTIRNGAAPIWHALMIYAARDLPPENWEMPAGVTRVEVCDPSGLLPTVYCPETVREPFTSGTEPTTFDNLFQPYLVNRETGKLATLNTPVELVEERVYLVPPPEAAAWASAVGIEQPPQEYDTLTEGESQDRNLRITSPEPFAFLRGVVRVRGYVNLDGLDFYRLQVGKGLNPLNWVQLGEDKSVPVGGGVLAEWDSSELEGLYTLQLIAVEEDGQVRNALVHVTVDNEPPTGEIVFPQDEQVFTGTFLDEVVLQVEAQDRFGVEKVVFFVDGEEIESVRGEPFSVRWPMHLKGSHTAYAEVYDLAGNMVETGETTFEIVRP